MNELARVSPSKSPAKKAAKKAPGKAAAKKAPGKHPPHKHPAKKAAKKAPHKSAAKKAAKKAPGKNAAGKKTAGKKAAGKKAAPRSPQHDPSSHASAARPRPSMALPAPPTDPLIILGLSTDFGAADLRRAWRRFAARHHPDQGGDAATFARGRRAYEALRQQVS